jgi:DNA replication protein DnaC
MSETSLYQQVRSHLAYLRLQAAAEALPALLEQTQREQMSHTASLAQLLRIEVAATEQRRLDGRLRFACLPAPWTLDNFDFDAQPGVDRKLVEELASLRFIEEHGNALLIGPPGVGKTRLSIALGHLAVHAGYRVYSTTAADLAAGCHRGALEGRWDTVMRFFAQPSLLIIDELGYLPLAGEAASALFQVVARRYLKGSIILTINRGIPSWGQIFDDPMVAAAMLDRLLHKSVVLQIDGESYPHARTSRPCRGAQEGGDAYRHHRLTCLPDRAARLGNFGDRAWGISAILITVPDRATVVEQAAAECGAFPSPRPRCGTTYLPSVVVSFFGQRQPRRSISAGIKA